MIKIEFYNQWKDIKKNFFGISLIEINFMSFENRIIRLVLLGLCFSLCLKRKRKYF